jgi:hypothetical protein
MPLVSESGTIPVPGIDRVLIVRHAVDPKPGIKYSGKVRTTRSVIS